MVSSKPLLRTKIFNIWTLHVDGIDGEETKQNKKPQECHYSLFKKNFWVNQLTKEDKMWYKNTPYPSQILSNL